MADSRTTGLEIYVRAGAGSGSGTVPSRSTLIGSLKVAGAASGPPWTAVTSSRRARSAASGASPSSVVARVALGLGDVPASGECQAGQDVGKLRSI